MYAWRCVKAKYADAAFSGVGSSEHPGRWNPRGMPAVYASDSAALCVLEALMDVRDLAVLAKHWVLIRVKVPQEQAAVLGKSLLPKKWAEFPHGLETQKIGSQWLDALESPVLLVPSAVVDGRNVLLNPRHPDLGSILETASRPLALPFKDRFTGP